MDAIDMVETVFAADFSEDPEDVHARACMLATVLAYHPSYFIVPRLAARVCVLVGEIPVERRSWISIALELSASRTVSSVRQMRRCLFSTTRPPGRIPSSG